MATLFFTIMCVAAAAEFILAIADMTLLGRKRTAGRAEWSQVLIGSVLVPEEIGGKLIDKGEEKPKRTTYNRNKTKHGNNNSRNLIDHNKLFQPELFPEYIDGCA